MYGLHLSNTAHGVSVLQKQNYEDQHWDLEGANSAYGQALRKELDLDWDQLTYIAASAEAKDRLNKDCENYRQQKEQQREQQRQEEEKLRQQKGEDPPINLAGLEALKRGFGLRGGHGSHLLAPSAARTAAAKQGATNARMAVDSVVAARQLIEDGDLQAVTEEILARVRAQDAMEAELLPPLPEEDMEESGQPAEEVKYSYHYGHSRGMAPGSMEEPSMTEEDLEVLMRSRQRSSSRKRRPRARSSSRGRGLVSLYVEQEDEEEEDESKVPQKSKCPDGHALERWVCRIDGVQCEECGPFPLPRHSVFFGCRTCNYHLCSLHGMAGEPEAKPKADGKSKASDAKPQPQPEEAEPTGDSEPTAPDESQAAAAEQAPPEAAVVEEPRGRQRPEPQPEPARGRQKLSYKERMKQKLEQQSKRLEDGKDIRRYEWAETGEAASARDAEGIMNKLRQEREEEMEAMRPPSPVLQLPEDFCPLCHQIATGAKKPLTRGGHTFKAGCRRAKGA